MVSKALLATLLLGLFPATALAGSHPDPQPPAGARIAPRSQFVHRAAPTTWCGTSRTTDDVTNALSDKPRIKVVYAYASDGTDRLASYGNLIQQSATWVADSIGAGAGGLRAPRFDYGIACDPQALDIISMRLPRTAAQYRGMGTTERGETLLADVHAYVNQGGMQLGPGPFNFLVFADNVITGWASGYGEWWDDDRPGVVNKSNIGNAVAVVIGGGGPNFSATVPDSGDLDRLAYAVTHEVGHGLGAVQATAPHATGAGHCTDGYSIMCYNDHGPNGSAFGHTACPIAGVDITSFAGVPFDCNADDYLRPPTLPTPSANEPAHYVVTHWNIYDSPFMCDAAACLARDMRPPEQPAPDPQTPLPSPIQEEQVPNGLIVAPPAQQSTPAPPATVPVTSHQDTPPAQAVASIAYFARVTRGRRGVTSIAIRCPRTATTTCRGTVRVRAGARTRTVSFTVARGAAKSYRLSPPAGLKIRRSIKASLVLRDRATGKARTHAVTLRP